MNFILLNLGKIMFPKLPPDLQRRRLAVFLFTVLVSVTVAGVTVLMMTQLAKMGRH